MNSQSLSGSHVEKYVGAYANSDDFVFQEQIYKLKR